MNHPLRGLPLRIRLVAAVVILVAAGLAVSGVVATLALHSYLLQRLDNQLVAAPVPPGGCADVDRGGRGGGRYDPHAFATQYYVAHYNTAGVRDCTLTAPSTTATPDLGTLSPSRAQALSRHAFTVSSTDDGAGWRAVVRLMPDGDVQLVATQLSDIDHTVSRLVLLEVAIGLVVLVLLAGGGYFVIERSLQPLIDVERTAAAIAGGDLTRRIAPHDPRTEVGRLTRALNTMLTQIEQAFARQRESEQTARQSEERMRRFVADASHELRTPLTSIRGFAELYRQGAVSEINEVRRVMRRVEDEATRMGLLVDDLLLLARLDQERPLELAPVDLLDIAGDAVHDAQALAPDRDITLTVVQTPPIFAGDEARLRQVVHNILGNALQHTPAGTPVDVRLSGDERQAMLEVVDHGPGLSPDARDRVFERFYRVDESRARAAGGAGLGLSIVAALVAAHGGSVSVAETPGGGATFRVALPATPTQGPLRDSELGD